LYLNQSKSLVKDEINYKKSRFATHLEFMVGIVLELSTTQFETPKFKLRKSKYVNFSL